MTRRLLAILPVALSLWLVGCGVPGPDSPADSFELDFSGIDPNSADGVIVFMVDGLNPTIFEQMLAAGELPAIERHFISRGLYAPRAVVNLPSVTLANQTSLVTGCWPGHHGVTGITWFDRNRLLYRNYATIAQKNTLDGDYLAPTIFERLPDRTTFSLFYQAHRGATKFVENWISAGPPFYFGWHGFVDRITLNRFDMVADVARARNEWPAVTFVYQLYPDMAGYDHGLGEQYREAIRHVDTQLGRVLADLGRAGLLEKLHLVLVADHGFVPVERHFNVDDFLACQLGLAVGRERHWEKTPFERRLEIYQPHQAVTYGSGDRYWAICLRKPIRQGGRCVGFAPWPRRPGVDDLRSYPIGDRRVDLVAELLATPAVDAVAYAAGADTARVATAGGVVEFAQPDGRGGAISYRVLEGRDPLGYAAAGAGDLLNGRAWPIDRWLSGTLDAPYPAIAPQMVAYFRAPRAGDLALFASAGWDFGPDHRAGHGGLDPEEMLAPMIIAGPGIEPRRIRDATTADLTPTILDILGRDVPEDCDGRSLLALPSDE